MDTTLACDHIQRRRIQVAIPRAGCILVRECSMSKSQEKRIALLAEAKGYRVEKVGKGPHHGRFCLVAGGARAASGVPGAEFSFTLEEAEHWLAKHGKAAQ